MEFHLLRPQWLLTLIPAVVLLALLWRQRKRSGSWQAVIEPQLLRHLISGANATRASNLLPLVFLGWILGALAASGPSWHKIPQPVHQKQDALVVLLDLSYSMKSADLPPSRLDRARQKLLDLLKLRREGQTGLIAYAGDAHIVTPLTDDTPTIANLLPALSPDMMPLPGSDPVSAVTQALELLRSAGIRDGRILLVTDGVSDKDRKGIEKVLAGSSNARLSVMGVGTASGAPIPLPKGGFLKDEQGAIVMPGLDEQGLRELANATGGSYRRMQMDDSDLQPLVTSNAMTDTSESLVAGRTADTWDDQGYLLTLALLPLALGLFRRGWLITLFPLLLLAQTDSARASTWDDLWLTRDQQGQRALQQGDNKNAATLFKNPGWAGTAAYNSGDYETATDRFNQAENADSLYNRGNALAHTGKLDEAIASYEKSLALKPDQADAKANLDMLRKMKEQQQNQKQDKNQQQDQNKDQKQNKSQQEQNQQQGQNQQQPGQDQKQGQDQQQAQDQQKDQQPGKDQPQAQDQQQAQDRQQGEDQQRPQNQQQGQDKQQAQNQQQAKDQQESQEAQHQSGKQDDTAPDKQQAQAQPTAPGEAAKEKSGEEQPGQVAQAAQATNSEKDQAMEQWLRRVPDDPSGLLRQKFRYESRVRQQQGVGRDDENYW